MCTPWVSQVQQVTDFRDTGGTPRPLPWTVRRGPRVDRDGTGFEKDVGVMRDDDRLEQFDWLTAVAFGLPLLALLAGFAG